ncbi:MAG: molybdenum cofactor guanylyltransferase [Nitrospira sp.]|nr:molybdenum cofactor guanylyltransferase [Nitrospira sp.]
MISDVTGILLAGGKSRRMGEDKRFLLVGGQPLYARSLAILRSIFQEVRIVIAQDSPALSADVPVSRDHVPNCGTLGGIYTALKESETAHIFVVACDMPYLNSDVICYLVSLKNQADAVIVRLSQGVQPTHAVYSRQYLPVFEEMIQSGRLKVQDCLSHSSIKVRLVEFEELREIDPNGHSFLNVNTPADLEIVRSLHDQLTKSHPSG